MKGNKKLLALLVVPTVAAGVMVARGGGERARQSRIRAAGRNPVPAQKAAPAVTPLPVAARSERVPNGVRDPQSGLTVPRGFKVSVFASGLNNPRRLVIAPGGTARRYDVFVAESKANRVTVLRDGNGDGRAEASFVWSDRLDQPYGLAFHPNGFLYVGNTDAVVRFPFKTGQTSTQAAPQRIADLTRGGYNQHWTRNLLFADGGRELFVTVGSSCNVCEESDPQRAAISVMRPDGSGRRVFASGLRNPVGLAMQGGRLWTVVNGRDWLGDNTPPDYLTAVRDGGFYGWPYAYGDLRGRIIADPDLGARRPDLVKKTLAPTVPVQAHSAALGVAFYPKLARGAGVKAFPAAYEGDAFLAFHGSWNRSAKTGYKIVRVDFQKGRPVALSDFARGFDKGNGQTWGRPVDVLVAPDGALLFSDDDGGKIWRVAL